MGSTFADLWTELKAEAVSQIAALEADAAVVEANITPIVESDLVALFGQFKTLLISTVLNLAKAEFSNLTGQEKQGNVVTTVFQAAEASGVSLLLSDATMLAQQAYNAVGASLSPAPAA
jgi:hypothetical protein